MAESAKSTYAAIAADTAIAATKFVAAGFTGSASMLTEGFHSVVDTGIAALTLLGMYRSRRPPDALHPFGYGRELYYWTNVMGILLFSLGGGMSVLEGIRRLMHPQPPESPIWNYSVLAISGAFSLYSTSVGYRQIRQKHPDQPIWQAIRTSKDPRNFSPFLLDIADINGLLLAFVGVLVSQWMGTSVPDGIAALLIGFTLAAAAVVLSNEARKLLLGESAGSEVVRDIRTIAVSDPAVEKAPHPLTMQLSPSEVLLNLNLEFRPGLSADEVQQAIERLEHNIRRSHPDVKHIFIENHPLESHSGGGQYQESHA